METTKKGPAQLTADVMHSLMLKESVLRRFWITVISGDIIDKPRAYLSIVFSHGLGWPRPNFCSDGPSLSKPNNWKLAHLFTYWAKALLSKNYPSK